MNDIKKVLEEEIARGGVIHIHRSIGNSPILCVPLDMGEEILLIQYLYDFRIDGYAILRINDISEIDAREEERFIENILKKEGIYKNIKKPDINIGNTMIDILNEISKIKVNFILECEELDNEVIYIGKIESLEEKLIFKTFGVLGEWDHDDLLEVEYDDITQLRCDEYSTIYSKYLKD